jgi:hypothetical protein
LRAGGCGPPGFPDEQDVRASLHHTSQALLTAATEAPACSQQQEQLGLHKQGQEQQWRMDTASLSVAGLVQAEGGEAAAVVDSHNQHQRQAWSRASLKVSFLTMRDSRGEVSVASLPCVGDKVCCCRAWGCFSRGCWCDGHYLPHQACLHACSKRSRAALNAAASTAGVAMQWLLFHSGTLQGVKKHSGQIETPWTLDHCLCSSQDPQ